MEVTRREPRWADWNDDGTDNSQISPQVGYGLGVGSGVVELGVIPSSRFAWPVVEAAVSFVHLLAWLDGGSQRRNLFQLYTSRKCGTFGVVAASTAAAV
jgi:hypothetical protein